MFRPSLLALGLALVLTLAGCGGGGGDGGGDGPQQPPPTQGQVQVSLTPAEVELAPSTAFQFNYGVTGTDNVQCEWTTTGGTISAAGLYTAPATEGTYRVTMTSVADRSRSVTATVRVRAPTTNPSTWVTGYYAGWSWHGYPPEKVDMTAMTHFVFGRIAPGSGTLGGTAGQIMNGAITAQELPGSPYAPQTVEDYLVSRAHASGKKALIMLGGAGDGVGFYNSTANGVRRTFVVNLVNYMVQHDYDGIDVDWEDCLSLPNDCEVKFPQEEARRRLKALIAEVRAEANSRPRYQGAGRQVIITFPWYSKSINFLEPGGKVEQWEADIAAIVDQFNLMSYGNAYVADGWKSWHFGPIYGATGSTPYDLNTSVAAYVATGVPRKKIGIGIGFYGIFYSPDITAPGQWVTDATDINNDDNALGYNQLRAAGYFTNPNTYHWDGEARASYRSYNSGNGFPNGYTPPDGAPPAGMLSYEDEASIRAKGAWARDPETAVGGAIIWTINFGWLDDTQTNPLLDEVKRSFLQ